MNNNFTIDQNKCISCGKCINVCFEHVFYTEYKSVLQDNPNCLKCYHCYAVCPNDAISIKNFSESPNLNEVNSIKPENLINLFSKRRSYRKFQDKEINNELLEKIIESGNYIPSGGNARSYNITVIKNSEIRNLLKNELNKIYKIRSIILNNFLLGFLIKPFLSKFQKEFLKNKEYGARFKRLIDESFPGGDPFFYNAPVVVIIHSKLLIPTPKEDAILAAYNINLSAEINGLGGCFVTLAQEAINSSIKCKNILNLNKNDNVYAVLILGYPESKYLRIVPRMKKKANWI